MMQQPHFASVFDDGSTLRLLIVDDDDVDRERIRRMLANTRQHMSIVEATSLTDARRLTSSGQFDCIILDYHVGNEIGTALLPELAEQDQKSSPVVMITGRGDERIAVQAMQNGVFDYIPKSQLQPALLEAVITGAVRRAKLEEEILTRQARIERLSLYDALTGVPNRVLFFDRVRHTLTASLRTREPFCVLQLDLDLFKQVNDTYGHATGDAVLRVAAQRLQASLRASDTVARLGGDEFAIILMGVGSADAARIAADKIISAVREPIIFAGVVIHIGVSIGIALFPEHAEDVDGLLAKADRAMYRAKGGQGCQIYVREMECSEPMAPMVTHLKMGIERGELSVVYQPIVNLATRRVVGVEALARWSSAEYGAVSPAVFIPLAERSELIFDLTSAVVDIALRQCKTWRSQGMLMPVSINLSARMLDDDALPERVLQTLRDHGLPPQILKLELTETALISSVDQAQRVLKALRKMGIGISIDDFGAGYTSFKYLRDLDVTEIKIDQLFTAASCDRERDDVIVRSIAVLAQGFGIPVTAEGIEDLSLCARLRGLGCDNGQGYALSRPLPVGEFNYWVARQVASHTLWRGLEQEVSAIVSN